MKIFGPKWAVPPCVPDRIDSATPREHNRHRIKRLVSEARKGQRAAALLFGPDALYVVFLSWLDGRACVRCAGENGDRLFYQRELSDSAVRFTIARLVLMLNPDENLPL
jgi:hypothetical protein